jgi:hypothetical protein
MKVYITKKDPLAFAQSGLKSLTFWFDKPYFKEGRAIDDICGPLEWKDYVYPRWISPPGQCSIDGHIIFKNFPNIKETIWNLIISTYSIEFLDEFDFYDKIADSYQVEKNKKIRWINSHSENILDKALHFEKILKIEKDVCDVIEKNNWQEWVYELDLNLSIK